MPVMDPKFYQKLLQVASDVQLKPEDILNVMAVESGIDPASHNEGGGNASGLLQFMPATLKNLGFPGGHADFRKLSAVDQLDWVEKLIKSNMRFNGGPFKSAAQYYVANFLPLALKLPGIQHEDPATVIVAKNPDRPHLPGISTHQEAIFYRDNPGLDADKDGQITFGDIQKVLRSAAAGKNYQTAIAQLEHSTGYQPNRRESSMVASNTPNNNMYNILDRYVQQVLKAAHDRSNKKIFKKFLPNHDILIHIYADSLTDAVEFGRILTSALDEELLASTFIHTNGDQIEVQCNISGPADECFETVKELTVFVSEAFEVATKKIGGIKVKTNCVMNKKSSNREIDLKTANSQYRKFLLKFV